MDLFSTILLVITIASFICLGLDIRNIYNEIKRSDDLEFYGHELRKLRVKAILCFFCFLLYVSYTFWFPEGFKVFWESDEKISAMHYVENFLIFC